MSAIRFAKTNAIVIAIVLSLSAALAYEYFDRVDRPNFEPRLQLHNQIVQTTAASPYRYRILVPLMSEAIRKALSVIFSDRQAFLFAYAVYDFAAVFFLLISLFIYLRIWFSRDQALIGILFVAGTMPIGFRDHHFQPWSLLEPGLFSASLLAIYKKQYLLLGLLIALATGNRETGLFIPLAFLCASLDLKPVVRSFLVHKAKLRLKDIVMDWKTTMLSTGYLLIWAVIFFGLRYFLGNAPHVETVEGLLSRNTKLASLFYTVVNATLFLGVFWIFAIWGFGYAPNFLRKIAMIVPFYLLTVMLWGVWYEVRLLMPLYSILIPLGLSFVYRKTALENLNTT